MASTNNVFPTGEFLIDKMKYKRINKILNWFNLKTEAIHRYYTIEMCEL